MSYDYEKTHEMILKSAKKIFSRVGFRNASIRNICKDDKLWDTSIYILEKLLGTYQWLVILEIISLSDIIEKILIISGPSEEQTYPHPVICFRFAQLLSVVIKSLSEIKLNNQPKKDEIMKKLLQEGHLETQMLFHQAVL